MSLPIQPNCPNCNQALKKMPVQKTKCPNCGEFMYVKYRPGEDRSQKQVVTAKVAAEIEQEWQGKHALQEQNRFEQKIRNLYETEDPKQIAFAHVLWARRYQPDQVRQQEHAHCRISILEYQDKTEFAGVQVNAKEEYCCHLCKPMIGRFFTVDAALKECLFPLDGCPEDRCSVWFYQVYLDELC